MLVTLVAVDNPGINGLDDSCADTPVLAIWAFLPINETITGNFNLFMFDGYLLFYTMSNHKSPYFFPENRANIGHSSMYCQNRTP